MMDTLTAIEGSALGTWIRESSSIWAYPTVLTLHTVGLAVLVGASVGLDLRLLGFGRAIPLATWAKSFRCMWVGFWINAASGVLLFTADTSKMTTTIFLWKLGIIALSVVVILLIKRVVYGREPELATVGGTARFLAVSSMVLWVAAIATGRLMAYV